MRRLLARGGFLLPALLVGAPPAVAAENIECASALVDEAVSNKIFMAYRAKADLGEKLNEMIGKKIAACMLEHDWSQEALESAMRVLFGQILERGISAELAAYPAVSIERLGASTDRYLAGLRPEELQKFADGEFTDETIVQLIRQLLADEVMAAAQLEDQHVAELIGEFAAARANATFFRGAFARQ